MAESDITTESLVEFFPDHPAAIDLLMDLWDVMQSWDDAVDGDPADHAAAYRTAIIHLPSNPLYNACLVPFLVAQCYYDWHTANQLEAIPDELNKAYMLRAGFFRIIISMIHLLRGPDVAEQEAPIIWRMYTEDFNEYQQEIEDHAQDRSEQRRQSTGKGAA